MIDLLIVPIAAICNIARGRGYKLASGVVLAGLYILLYWIDTKQLSLYTFTAFPIIVMGWYLANMVGTGYVFNAIHGRYAPKWKGTLYGCARGLLKAPMVVALAFLYHHPINALWGLLAGFSGICYWLGGLPKENKYSVVVAEALDGILLGIMIVGVL